MAKIRKAPSFKSLAPASKAASRAASASSLKRNTRCELLLRRELSSRGIRYRLTSPSLPGKPDLVFPRAKLAVFCDGDFWHGRELRARLKRLERGHNANYWTRKIMRNVERDRAQTRALVSSGWIVLRFWESDILGDSIVIADQVERVLVERLRSQFKQASR